MGCITNHLKLKISGLNIPILFRSRSSVLTVTARLSGVVWCWSGLDSFLNLCWAGGFGWFTVPHLEWMEWLGPPLQKEAQSSHFLCLCLPNVCHCLIGQSCKARPDWVEEECTSGRSQLRECIQPGEEIEAVLSNLPQKASSKTLIYLFACLYVLEVSLFTPSVFSSF